MNLPKQDRNTPRTAGDIERKYGKKVTETEKEVKSQAKDLASLNVNVKELIKNIEAINNQIKEINQKYEELGVVIETINVQVTENTKLRHEHTNKELLDEITEKDIRSWNYRLLASNIEVNEIIEDISSYNLILVLLESVDRYIPLYKYQDSYKGIVVTSANEGLTMEEIELEIEEDKIVNIISSYNVLEAIGVF